MIGLAPPRNVVAKNALISTQFAQDLILFGVGTVTSNGEFSI